MQKQIEQFIQYLKIERNYAKNTQLAYARDLQKLLDFSKQQSVNDWHALDTEHIELWVMNMRHNNKTARTIRRRLSSVRGFLNYLVLNQDLSSNCALGLQTPKVNQHLPKTLDYEQVLLLLNPQSSRSNELRDIAIIDVMYSCAVRVSELVSLDIQDVDFDQGFLKVMGKGSKMRYVPLGDSAKVSVANYLRSVDTNHGALFLTQKNTRISTRSIQQMIKKRAYEVGIKVDVHPHMLRHAAATHFLQSSHDLRSVQEFLGHSSIKSTQVYTHLDFLELSKVYDKCHPRARKK